MPVEWLRLIRGNNLVVFIAIAGHADRETGEAHPGRKLISEITNIGERDVERHLRSLEALGAIETTFGKNNSYVVQPPPDAYVNMEYFVRAQDHRERAAVVADAAADLTRANVISDFGSTQVESRSHPYVKFPRSTDREIVSAIESIKAQRREMPWALYRDAIENPRRWSSLPEFMIDDL